MRESNSSKDNVVILVEENGRIVQRITAHNLVTKYGRDFLAKKMLGVGASGTPYLNADIYMAGWGLGTGVTAPTENDVGLETEYWKWQATSPNLMDHYSPVNTLYLWAGYNPPAPYYSAIFDPGFQTECSLQTPKNISEAVLYYREKISGTWYYRCYARCTFPAVTKTTTNRITLTWNLSWTQ